MRGFRFGFFLPILVLKNRIFWFINSKKNCWRKYDQNGQYIPLNEITIWYTRWTGTYLYLLVGEGLGSKEVPSVYSPYFMLANASRHHDYIYIIAFSICSSVYQIRILFYRLVARRHFITISWNRIRFSQRAYPNIDFKDYSIDWYCKIQLYYMKYKSSGLFQTYYRSAL